MNYKKSRDKNEAGIVDALLAAGASVTRLDDAGVPDLLVGYQFRTFLLEVKQAERKDGKGHTRNGIGGEGELTSSQVKWWSSWLGAPARIVHNAREALCVIGKHEEDDLGDCAHCHANLRGYSA